MGLNWAGPLIRGNFFHKNSINFKVKNAVLHNPWLIESSNLEPWLSRADYGVIHKFFTAWRVGAPYPHIVQGSTVLVFLK